MTAAEYHLVTQRTARYHVLEPVGEVREVWMVLHGYGQLAAYFLRHFRPVMDENLLVVAPEALSRFYFDQQSGRVGAAWMTREDRLHEIDDYVAYLDAVAAAVTQPLDRSVPVNVFGFSQGATTACRWAVMGKTPVKRLVMWGGWLPHDLDYAQHAPALREKDLTFVVGTEDEYVTPERLAEQKALLEQHNLPYRLLMFEGGHRLHAETLAQVMDR